MGDTLKIQKLREEDKQPLVDLVNSAYRGEGSKKGWTTEADLIEGALRIDMAALETMLAKPGVTILTCSNREGLLGCVYLEQKNKALYLGMLSVSPEAQGLGIGKKLLYAAEEHAKASGCTYIDMTVIDLRHELIAWYERHGYERTGETKPFHDDKEFGVPTKPLQFIVLKKLIDS